MEWVMIIVSWFLAIRKAHNDLGSTLLLLLRQSKTNSKEITLLSPWLRFLFSCFHLLVVGQNLKMLNKINIFYYSIYITVYCKTCTLLLLVTIVNLTVTNL
jgi:hypothetical protein